MTRRPSAMAVSLPDIAQALRQANELLESIQEAKIRAELHLRQYEQNRTTETIDSIEYWRSLETLPADDGPAGSPKKKKRFQARLRSIRRYLFCRFKCNRQ
jgi:hypothetical protein